MKTFISLDNKSFEARLPFINAITKTLCNYSLIGINTLKNRLKLVTASENKNFILKYCYDERNNQNLMLTDRAI